MGGSTGAPLVRPSNASKLNTVLQLGTTVGALSHAAWGVPVAEGIELLGIATAGTTVGSTLGYGVSYARGNLFRNNQKKNTW